MGKYSSSLQDLNKALEIDTLYDKIYHDKIYGARSVAKMGLGYYEDALQDCNKAIEISATWEYYVTRAEIKVVMNKFEEAVIDLGISIEIKESAIAHCELGYINLYLKKYKEAEYHFNRSLAMYSAISLAHRGKAFTVAIFKDKKLGEYYLNEIEYLYRAYYYTEIQLILKLYTYSARVYLIQENYPAAFESVEKGLELRAEYQPLLDLKTAVLQKYTPVLIQTSKLAPVIDRTLTILSGKFVLSLYDNIKTHNALEKEVKEFGELFLLQMHVRKHKS